MCRLGGRAAQETGGAAVVVMWAGQKLLGISRAWAGSRPFTLLHPFRVHGRHSYESTARPMTVVLALLARRGLSFCSLTYITSAFTVTTTMSVQTMPGASLFPRGTTLDVFPVRKDNSQCLNSNASVGVQAWRAQHVRGSPDHPPYTPWGVHH